MKIALTGKQMEDLQAFIEADDDAEDLGDGEYTVDIFELDPPLSLELTFIEGGVDALAAATLAYDPAQDGWYIKERIDQPDQVEEALMRWSLMQK